MNRLIYFDILRLIARPVTDKKYDVAVDFNSYRNECSIGAVLVEAKKRVMWIHNDVEIKRRNEWKYRVLWHFFRRKFRLYDEFAAVSPGVIDGFRRCSGIYDKKITHIPNHIDTGEIFRGLPSRWNSKWIPHATIFAQWEGYATRRVSTY
jgi:glycosyltransferase involved in cell wall biosynthesis